MSFHFKRQLPDIFKDQLRIFEIELHHVRIRNSPSSEDGVDSSYITGLDGTQKIDAEKAETFTGSLEAQCSPTPTAATKSSSIMSTSSSANTYPSRIPPALTRPPSEKSSTRNSFKYSRVIKMSQRWVDEILFFHIIQIKIFIILKYIFVSCYNKFKKVFWWYKII